MIVAVLFGWRHEHPRLMRVIVVRVGC